MTHRKAPEAVLVALAEAADVYERKVDDIDADEPEGRALLDGLLAYRAAVAPLRTRAEVDAEIANGLRAHVDKLNSLSKGQRDATDFQYAWEKLKCLCSEPTADETEACPIHGTIGIGPGDAWCKLCPSPTAEKTRALPAECEWCQDSTQPQLHQYRIPESIVRVCTRCLEERGVAAKVKP